MKPIYRPEIDGLRAIAVTSVIIYHAQLITMPLSGGYIGVDIFFVISGYLITKIILEQLQTNKKFSFTNFFMKEE